MVFLEATLLHSTETVELQPAVEFPEQDPDYIPSYPEKGNDPELVTIDLSGVPSNTGHLNTGRIKLDSFIVFTLISSVCSPAIIAFNSARKN
jgi:hypothetical protein